MTSRVAVQMGNHPSTQSIATSYSRNDDPLMVVKDCYQTAITSFSNILMVMVLRSSGFANCKLIGSTHLQSASAYSHWNKKYRKKKPTIIEDRMIPNLIPIPSYHLMPASIHSVLSQTCHHFLIRISDGYPRSTQVIA